MVFGDCHTPFPAMLHGLNSPKGRLILIEALVLLGTVLLFLLIIFGSFRRRSGNTVIQGVVWVAYTCSTYLVVYTVGLMQSSGVNNGLLALWGICLSLVLGSAISISAYGLEDNENWKKNLVEHMIYIFIICGLVGTYVRLTHSGFKVPVIVLSILTAARVGQRTDAFRMATKTNGQKKSKLIADYKKYEPELTPQDEPDPTNMRGYNYLVYGEDRVGRICKAPDYLLRIEITDHRVITVNKIWRCTGSLLNSSGDPEGRLKDICLSFALFKLIQRRFSGYQHAESSLQKTRDFVIRGLLSNDDDAHERAFRVIENKLGQFSLLEHCDYKPTAKNKLYNKTCEIVGKARAGQKQSKRLKLPREVKKAVVRWLKLNHDALPTNGISSLQRNGVIAQLSWACNLETHAQVILVWHIATSLCEIHGSRVERAKVTSMEMKDNQVVANSLSRYCAYLVGFVPDLLPDNGFVAQLIFDNAVKEASSLLGTFNLDQRFRSMMNLSDTSQTVVCRGATLGKQLIDMETPEMRWKVMAEFWVEMILFLAPSDNAKAHAEGLARGGEFITHLWALLSHAGILGRGHSCIL
ncbi:uncharacterized protein LOC135592941 [Musa acuminata AAA Group]|uniref:uncharacterized protein LOC135592941 n=1 Tax=Musa acuminata AAA Group TaxID=214697 RepID=UPI0031CF46D5